jgi:hypothetical protein
MRLDLYAVETLDMMGCCAEGKALLAEFRQINIEEREFPGSAFVPAFVNWHNRWEAHCKICRLCRVSMRLHEIALQPTC